MIDTRSLNPEFLRDVISRFGCGSLIVLGECSPEALRTAAAIVEVHTVRGDAKGEVSPACSSKVSLHEDLSSVLDSVSGSSLVWFGARGGESAGATEVKQLETAVQRLRGAIFLIQEPETGSNPTHVVGGSLREIHRVVSAAGLQFYVLGSVALAFPSVIACEMSPVIMALTVSRLYDGENLTIEEVIHAERTIAQAGGHEREVLLRLPENGPPSCGYQYSFWRALNLAGQNKYLEAASEFARAGELGFSHWRLHWYLALVLHQAGQYKLAEDLLRVVLQVNPHFEPAKALIRENSRAAAPAAVSNDVKDNPRRSLKSLPASRQLTEPAKSILLINPHDTQQLGFTCPPLGLLYLAGALVEKGFEVRVVDACLDGKEAAVRALREVNPSVVGITCLTPGRHKALELARIAKEIAPQTMVVLGGAHPTIMHQQMLTSYPFIDAIVLGEGEQTLVELALGKNLAEIKGLAYRAANKTVRTAPRQNVADLDLLPRPAWHTVDLSKYPPRGEGMFRGIDLAREPRVSVIFSRGCVGSCDFCSTWWIWRKWRHRSARHMVDELQMLHQKQGIRHFCFADDAFSVDRNAVIELCDEIIARALHIAFHVTTRTDCVDEVVLGKLHQAGCYQIAFGVESGSEALLQKMGKKTDTATAEKAIALAKAAGLRVTALMIIGNVGETGETLRQTISFLKRTKPTDVGCVGGLWVLPGTRLHAQCKRQGSIDDEFWLGPEPYRVYTQEWSQSDLDGMQQLVANYWRADESVIAGRFPAGQESVPGLLRKWQRYVKVDVQEYSATTEWTDAQAQHVELMSLLPSQCTDILDLGCGDGWTTNRLKQLGKRAVGVTINPREAEHARRLYGLGLVVADMHDLQLPDARFDAIYSRESYEHTVAPYIAMCEMNRVLRPNGYLLINLPWDEWIREDSHYSVLNPAQMREMFYKCRFVVEKEGRSSRGHFWYLARKVAEIGVPHPCRPPVPGKPWLNGNVVEDQPPGSSALRERPRIIAMLRVKNEERWIRATLEKASPVVDGFVILDDGSTDRTAEYCRQHPKLVRYEFQNEPIVDEVRDKNRLLRWTLDLKPDWILALDGDELLEDAAAEAIRREIAACPPDVTALGFTFLYMWDSPGQYRADGKYAGLKHPRLFRVAGIGLDAEKLSFASTGHGANFHCGSIPANLPGQVRYVDICVKHYGYFERSQRERKQAFYVAHDPHNAAAGYYNHLTDETGMILKPWAERTSSGSAPVAVGPVKAADAEAMLDKLPKYYRHTRAEIVNAVPCEAAHVLDIGCGAGMLGRKLKELAPNRTVAGIELNPAAAQCARAYLDAVYEGDAECLNPPFKAGEFDCIVVADILEHLRDPWGVLRKFLCFLKPGGTLVASIPNVRRLTVLHNLTERGLWQYEDEGVLDRTHLRFFTLRTFAQALQGAGLTPQTVSCLGGAELERFRPGPDQTLRLGRLQLSNVTTDEFHELCALQFLFVCRKALTVNRSDSHVVGTAPPAPERTARPAIVSRVPVAELKASVVVLCHNRLDMTRNCVAALFRNTPAELFELIIADNCSTDGTADFLSKLEVSHRNVRVLRNPQNLGFVAGNNVAAKLAKADHLVLLNNDTEPQPGWLEALLEIVRDEPRAGAVGAKLVYPDGRLQEAGAIIFSDASGWNYGRGDTPHHSKYNFVREVDYCSGACLLVRKHIFEQVGGFDERYAPAYYEDADLCFSVRQAGFRVLYQPASVVIHHEGATAGTNTQSGYKRYQVINQQKFKEKWAAELPRQYSQEVSAVTKASDRRAGRNILVVDAFMPMYDRAAGSRRMHELLRMLSKASHRVTFIAQNGSAGQRYASELQVLGIEVYHATNLETLVLQGYQGQTSQTSFEELLGRGYDLAILSFWHVAARFMPRIRSATPQTRIIVDSVDLHYVREIREADLAGSSQLATQAMQRKRLELATYARADEVIVVTETDRAALLKELPSATISIVPTIHPVGPAVRHFAERNGVLFVGNFAHPPNLDAVLWFHQSVWPKVKAMLPGAVWTIVGNGPPPAVQALASDSVVVTGYVPETEPYLHSSRVSIAPLRYGAGIKGKIGDAMAAGLPVVTTSVGAEGMAEGTELPFIACDDPQEFADAVVRLYKDPAAWNRYSELGRAHVRAHYTPDCVSRQLEEIVSRHGARQLPAALPPCALVGDCAAARELCHENKLAEAWTSALACIQSRPFHPEAFLVLAEIAQKAGDFDSARLCAEHARRQAPGWKPARRFLNRCQKGGKRPDWLKIPDALQHTEPLLCACILVKGDEKSLRRCLRSLQGLADQVVLAHAGSNDHCLEIAKEFGAETHSLADCTDISIALNVALEHANGHWVLALNSNEEVPADSARQIRQNLGCTKTLNYTLPLAGAGQQAQCTARGLRLFRNAAGLYFAGPEPETVGALLEPLREKWGLDERAGTAVVLRHDVELKTSPRERDRDSLKQAETLAREDRHVEAFKVLQEMVGVEGPLNHEAWKLGAQIALSRPEFLEFAGDWTREALNCYPDDIQLTALRAEALLLGQEAEAARDLWQRVCTGSPQQPVPLAALILCEVAEGDVKQQPAAAEMAATTGAFLDWYRKCIAFEANSLVFQVNSHLDALERALPQAVRMLTAAMAEAETATA